MGGARPRGVICVVYASPAVQGRLLVSANPAARASKARLRMDKVAVTGGRVTAFTVEPMTFTHGSASMQPSTSKITICRSPSKA